MIHNCVGLRETCTLRSYQLITQSINQDYNGAWKHPYLSCDIFGTKNGGKTKILCVRIKKCCNI